jgi:ribonuclease BN (tRNA processing enzyme)
MALRFTVLASGSGGNASLVEAGGFGLLLDVGLGPRQLAARLATIGATWASVQAVLLTHTHSDHWNSRTLFHLHRRGIPLYCHADHLASLRNYAPACTILEQANLLRSYEADTELALAPGLRCRPLPVRHDGGATFGFRFEAGPDLFGSACALAYAADLGSWDQSLAHALADVDLLALEFNHDVELEYASGRHPQLIARVLGDHGHLSNVQAAALLREVLQRSAPGRLRHLVQLHLSRDCNRPALAAEAARLALAERAEAIEVHTASQDEPGPTLHLGAAAARARRSPRRRPARTEAACQPWLPGLE